jgi:hypothetical protein
MGINCTAASAVCHGPLHLGGMDIFNLKQNRARGCPHESSGLPHTQGWWSGSYAPDFHRSPSATSRRSLACGP